MGNSLDSANEPRAAEGGTLPESSQGSSDHPAPGRAERTATRVAFFIGGFASSCWVPLVPYAKRRLGLDDGSLGLVLLCFGVGSLATMLFAGWAAGKIGCRKVLRIASLLACAALPLLACLASVPLFIAALLLFGSAIGAIDVTVNIQAVIVERGHGRPLMSGFHAGWSIGGFVGSGLMTGLCAIGIDPLAATLLPIALVVCLHFVFSKGLLPYGSPAAKHERMRFPEGIVLAIGALCFISFLAEGSVMDWGAVFLSSNKGVDISLSGLGYMTFSVVMLICRIAGDEIVKRSGGRRVLLFGGLLAAMGFSCIIISPAPVLAFAGFGLIGLGTSNIVPVLFSLAGKRSSMPAHQAISVVSTIAYTGILLGPAIIGGIAKLAGLPAGLGFVALLLLAISVFSGLAGCGHRGGRSA